jgi:glutathione S-transferase
VLEGAITDAGFIGSDAWTYADANATPILFYLARMPEGAEMMDARPKLKAYLERMMARPSFAATAPPQD